MPEGSAPWAEPVVLVFDKGTYECLGRKNRPHDASGFVDRVGDRVWPKRPRVDRCCDAG